MSLRWIILMAILESKEPVHFEHISKFVADAYMPGAVGRPTMITVAIELGKLMELSIVVQSGGTYYIP